MLIIETKCHRIFTPKRIVFIVPHVSTAVHPASFHITVIRVVSVVSTGTVVRIVVLWSTHVATTVPSHRRLVDIVEVFRSIIIEFDATELHM